MLGLLPDGHLHILLLLRGLGCAHRHLLGRAFLKRGGRLLSLGLAALHGRRLLGLGLAALRGRSLALGVEGALPRVLRSTLHIGDGLVILDTNRSALQIGDGLVVLDTRRRALHIGDGTVVLDTRHLPVRHASNRGLAPAGASVKDPALAGDDRRHVCAPLDDVLRDEAPGGRTRQAVRLHLRLGRRRRGPPGRGVGASVLLPPDVDVPPAGHRAHALGLELEGEGLADRGHLDA
mmetsp:Transcript_5448/g.16152  ORF Transcript_5448/g.16152 Transcript_5448/m.16152 type:complete len:235 (+) Transcript_5448:1486-2190(+)